MSKQKRLPWLRIAGVSIIGGILLAAASMFLFGVSRDFPITSHAYEIICQNADPYKTTETVHGFPFGFLKTYENSCITMDNEWQLVALLADVVVYSALLFVVAWVIYRRRAILSTGKIRSEHE